MHFAFTLRTGTPITSSRYVAGTNAKRHPLLWYLIVHDDLDFLVLFRVITIHLDQTPHIVHAAMVEKALVAKLKLRVAAFVEKRV